MSESADRSGLMHLLAWYRDMGVEAIVATEPTNWLEKGDTPPGEAARIALGMQRRPVSAAGAAAPRPAPPEGGVAPATGQQMAPPESWIRAPVAPDAALPSARAAASAAGTLDELAASLARFEGCALKATAKNLCFYRGAARSRIMLIGEAPGRDEDLAGRPFVGRAGQLLDRMLAAIGLAEADVHITNIVYWRPPGNRTPTPAEAQLCRPFLERQIELVAPEFLLLLGGAAAKHILDVSDGILRLRGRWRDVAVGGRGLRALPTLHPAYLLRSPAAKRQAWLDLLALEAAIKGTGQ